jgi:hypothetical protein
MDAALRDVAGLGDFFDLRLDAPAPRHRLADLSEAEVLDEYAARTSAAVARLMHIPATAVPRPVAVSLMSLGVSARVLAAPIATWVTAGVVPDVSPDRLGIVDSPDGRLLLTLVERAPFDGDLSDLIERLAPLNESFSRHGHLAERLLWGNVASAVAASGRLVALARPNVRAGVTALIRELLAGPRLRDAGSYPPTGDGLDGYRRTSCCLYYRLPGAGVCGDCVLATP